jgi:hypothetical protein
MLQESSDVLKTL